MTLNVFNITMNYILTEKQGLCCHPAKRLFVVDTLPIDLMGHLISEQPAQDGQKKKKSKHVLGSHPHGPVPPLHTMSNQGDCHSLTVHSEKAVQDRPVQGCLNRIFAIIMGNQ